MLAPLHQFLIKYLSLTSFLIFAQTSWVKLIAPVETELQEVNK